MTPTCEATSGHCEVIATSLRHRKPWTFKASCGSSSKARRPAADVKRLEEEEDDGIVVVAAAISVAFFTAIYLRVCAQLSMATFQNEKDPFVAFRVYTYLGFQTFHRFVSSFSGLLHTKEKL